MATERYSEQLSAEELSHSKTTPFVFPEKPDYQNPIVGFECNIYGFFNFILKDGTKSE